MKKKCASQSAADLNQKYQQKYYTIKCENYERRRETKIFFFSFIYSLANSFVF